MASKNGALLNSFISYCYMHPEERFWQALRNWSAFSFVFVAKSHLPEHLQDTFYWEGKNG